MGRIVPFEAVTGSIKVATNKGEGRVPAKAASIRGRSLSVNATAPRDS
jgi:hypothetical protein